MGLDIEGKRALISGFTKSIGFSNVVGLVPEGCQQIADQQGLSFDEMERRFFAEVRPSSLLQRFATPEEDANMIVYLYSECVAAINGAPVCVEGGVIKAAL